MPKTGATRYQKFIKSEKAKTKLKAKKDLPKGTNVTKTNFKVKKIVIREQLKQHTESEVLSTRKQNFKELLSRLNHFNVHSQVDALNGLRELITAQPSILEQNLGQMIHGVVPLTLNVEKLVRRESFKMVHLMLSNVAIEKINPFFDIMSTYLRCAMTHIDNRIQEDSLLFLDILLSCTPQKMGQDFHKIIANFLDMISKLNVDTKSRRTLTVNLDSKITSVKWRVKVLHRLQDYLQKFCEYNKLNNVNEPATKKTYNFDDTELNYYPLYNPIYTSVCILPCFSSKNSQDVTMLDEVEKFKQYVETLMSLLFETWLEVCPNFNADKSIETFLTEDSAMLLRYIIKIISFLFHITRYFDKQNPSCGIEKGYIQKYRQSFGQYFIQTFPYVTSIRTKQTKMDIVDFEDTITDCKLVSENLQICHLFILFNPFINVKNQSNEIHSILNYVEKTFNHSTQDEINDAVIKILNTIFSNEITSWTKNLCIMDALFRKIIWAYFNNNLQSSFKQKIFSLLCKIALCSRLSHFHTSDAFQMWLKNLPDILLEGTINVQTIDIIHKFAVCNNKTFNTVVKPKLLKIIENLPKVVVSDSIHDTNSYHKLFALLYWIKYWDNESLNLLEKQLIDNVYRGNHGKYIFDTLKLRSDNVM